MCPTLMFPRDKVPPKRARWGQECALEHLSCQSAPPPLAALPAGCPPWGCARNPKRLLTCVAANASPTDFDEDMGFIKEPV